MKFRGKLRPFTFATFTSLTLLAAFAFAGCSDSNDTPPATKTSSPGNATSNATGGSATAGAGSPATSGDAAPTDADRVYAKQLCTSLNNYLNDFLQKASTDPALLTDESKLLKVAGPAISSLGKELKTATPPADVKQYHDELIAKTQEVSRKVQDGTITSVAELASVTTGIKTPPKNVEARLQAAANETQECQDSLLAGSLFGG